MDPIARLADPILALRSQLGDAAAFEALVERHHAGLLYFVRRLIGSADAADDVMQEVWLTAYRQLPRLKDPGALTVWLYRIARGRTIDHLRRTRRLEPLPDDVAEAPANEDEDDAFTPADAQRIHLGLGRLSASHHEVLVLRFLEAMEYEQIAQVVGCNVGTVRSRLHYAKRALRQALEEIPS